MSKDIAWILFSILFASVRCELEGWESLGCWRDLPTRAIASLEGRSKLLSSNWKTRSNPLHACADAAANENLKVFAVQDGGQCFGGPYAQLYFDQYGPSNLCKGGVGGAWSNSVYSSKTSYRRVLEEKKGNEKVVKCNNPLDLVFLVDGAGESTTENKLRWNEMLNFVSKATEMFDKDSTRFGVISYGSKPKVIVNITQNKDELSLRDAIIGEKFPGGERAINDAMKIAWQDQFRPNKRNANKAILALTTGNMNYGPWGSSLFLTNKGIRILAFGVDKAPSYRYLESLASGKHPENIYSLDSEQMDKVLPFVAKDICTGLKRNKIETIKKDKEIDLFQSDEFETVGSVVERKMEEKGASDSRLKKQEEPMVQKETKAQTERKAPTEAKSQAETKEGPTQNKTLEKATEVKEMKNESKQENKKEDDRESKAEKQAQNENKLADKKEEKVEMKIEEHKEATREKNANENTEQQKTTTKSEAQRQSDFSPTPQTSANSFMAEGSYEKTTSDKSNSDVNSQENFESERQASSMVNPIKAGSISPVDNSSMSDGDIIEKLKESAVETLKKPEGHNVVSDERKGYGESIKSYAGNGKPLIREMETKANKEGEKSSSVDSKGSEKASDVELFASKVNKSNDSFAQNHTASLRNEYKEKDSVAWKSEERSRESSGVRPTDRNELSDKSVTTKNETLQQKASENTASSKNWDIKNSQTEYKSYSNEMKYEPSIAQGTMGYQNVRTNKPSKNAMYGTKGNTAAPSRKHKNFSGPTKSRVQSSKAEAQSSQGQMSPEQMSEGLQSKSEGSNIQHIPKIVEKAKSADSQPTSSSLKKTAATTNRGYLSPKVNIHKTSSPRWMTTINSRTAVQNRTNATLGNLSELKSARNETKSLGAEVKGHESASSEIKNQESGFHEVKGESLDHGDFNSNEGNKTKDFDRDIFARLQNERESIGKDEEQDELKNETESAGNSENYTDDEKLSDEAEAMRSDTSNDPLLDEDEMITQRALEQKKKEIDQLLKKLDEQRRRKRKRRKVRLRSKSFMGSDETPSFGYDKSDDDESYNTSEDRDVIVGEKVVGTDDDQTSFDDESKAPGDKPVKIEDDADYVANGMMKEHYIRDKPIDTRPYARHFLLMSHNESKPYHIRRPYKLIPTKKAVRVLNKLYTSKLGPNLTLSYDIFDPSYSSDDAKKMTKHSYNKLVKSVKHSSGSRKKAHRPTSKNSKKNSLKNHPSDKQQFFLRNTISADSDRGADTAKRQRETETTTDNSYLSEPQQHIRKSQRGSESKKYTETHSNNEAWRRKLPSAAANDDDEEFDVHQALEDSYAYYMRNQGYQTDQVHKIDGKASMPNPSRSFARSQDSFEGSALSGEPYLRSNVKESTASIYPSNIKAGSPSQGYTANRNMPITSKTSTLETYKEEIATARTLHQPAAGKTGVGKDLGNFSFRSLPDIDSGNYTIEQLADNKVFVTLKSKTGKLQTFYGATAKPSNTKTEDKENQNPSSTRTNDQGKINLPIAATDVGNNTHPSNLRKVFEKNANLTKSIKVLALDLAGHKKQKAKKKHKKKATKSKGKLGEKAAFYENSRHIQAAYSPRGNEYFQSSLQTSPAATGSFESRNSKFETSQNGRNFEAAGRRQQTSSTATATTAAATSTKTTKKDSNSLDKNLHLTAYDVYDNKLAHVDKPISYFTKDVRNRDPNRLIITENKDPYTDSSMVKLFIDSGDETSLLPDGPMGLKSHKKISASRSMAGSDASDDEFASDVDKLAKLEDSVKDSSTRSLEKVGSEAKIAGKQGEKKAGGAEASGKDETGVDHQESKNKKEGTKELSKQDKGNAYEKTANNSGNNQAKKSKQNEVRKIVEVKQNSKEQKKEDASTKPATEEKEKNLTKSSKKINSSTGKERSHESTQQAAKEAKSTPNGKDDVWVFETDSKQLNEQKTVANIEKSAEKHKHKQVRTGGVKALGSSENDAVHADNVDNGELFAKDESETATAPTAPKGESLIAKMGQAVGCTKPVKVLFAIDVSEAIGTGPTRQRKWDHMKRFLHSVTDKVTHGGSMGYIVYDTEPRFLTDLEPCDQKTEYFVTSGECLCDKRSASYKEGASACSTHAPTEDESIEDWGKQGPRTAKALQLAQRYFHDEAFGSSKKLIVLVTHQASTDDVTAAERSLKNDSISLVDIEIGERHNLKKRSDIAVNRWRSMTKRSNTFDDVIPRDHQMEVSFYKLDKAIENIFMKICKEKDPNKTRRSKIYATLNHRRNWW